MSRPQFAELLQSLAQQVESMNSTVLSAVESYRQESDDLAKKNQALQAALLAKSGEADAAAVTPVSVEPTSFMDHLAWGVVKLTVFNRELYVHRSILSSIPFFEAKLEHWCDEPVMLPEDITELAFENLLMRLYVGAPLPAGNMALCAQIIHLAKYWLLDGIVKEMTSEVLQMVKKEDVPVLDELAKTFEIEELSVAVENLQKEPLCSSQELKGIVGQALRGDGQAQALCTALLKGHPQAREALREQFADCSFDVWSTIGCKGCQYDRVVLCPGFQWIWQELKGVGLLKTELPFILGTMMSKLQKSTEFRRLRHVNAPESAPTTLAGALEVYGSHTFLFRCIGDMIDSATDPLCAGSLQPGDLKDLLTLMPMPKGWLLNNIVDASMAKLITDLPLRIGHKVLPIMMGRITDVGPKTAAALRKIAAGEA